MTSVWFFVVGATIGSFLNVVVHRLPLGIPLRHPKSRCPVCEVPIRRGDNLPIVGWLRLRGRCRSCGTRISIRYPLIEASMGFLFLGLLHGELLTGGANLPVRVPNSYANVLWIIWYTKWDLIGLFLYHAFLLSTLLVVVLIRCDSNPIPRQFLRFSILAGIGFSTIWP
ncbi:MAG: prepilin peptidase, partial [Planctomycetaceae bacterium]|nr:prepilin peptidase [Planctomycetaceae bacterium]